MIYLFLQNYVLAFYVTGNLDKFGQKLMNMNMQNVWLIGIS